MCCSATSAIRPRGRIYLIKEMFEQGTVTAPVTYHIDRCLSCLSCMTTCPSGVDYMHLVDLARIRIDHKRSPAQKTTRWLLAKMLPNPGALPHRLAVRLARASLPRAAFGKLGMKTGAAALALAPSRLPSFKTPKRESVVRPAGAPVKRVALLLGCVQDVLEPSINQAAIRLLRRHGVEVVMPTRGGLLRRRSSISSAARTRRTRPRGGMSMPGRARSARARSTPSSPPRPAAAP